MKFLSGKFDPHERRNDLGTVPMRDSVKFLVPVKMQNTGDRTERPHDLLQFDIGVSVPGVQDR